MVEVAASLLSADEEKIIQTLYDLEVGKTDYFHIDVMDGNFTEDDTIDKMMKYTEYIKQVSNLPIDVHLMVDDVESIIKDYLNMDVNCISFQVEACSSQKKIHELIELIKENNCKVGLAIAPRTDVEDILEFIPYIHKVIVMTVEPGQGGQELIPEMVQKVSDLNKYVYDNNYDIDIEVDGGINGMNAKQLSDAGANILVSGSYITNMNNYKEAIRILKNQEE